MTTKPIERVTDLDASTFRRDFQAACRPVVVSGGAARWPALSKWVPDLFRDTAGHLDVTVRRTDLDDPEIRSTSLGRLGADQGETKLARVLDRCAAMDPEDEREELYVPGVALWQVPSLARDWERPGFLDGIDLKGGTIWLGRNTRSIAHYHPAQHALLVQIAGRKRLTMYSPEDLDKTELFPAWSGSFYRSRINFHATRDVERRYPRLASATRWETILEPGDMAFIPVHWLHAPVGIRWSVSFTLWWKAELGEWAFPSPGLRCLFWNGVQRTAETANRARLVAAERLGRGAQGLRPANAGVHRLWHRLRTAGAAMKPDI
ncbi:cupin-like domain-containing protein [Myxococcota bacterium]|nr:cupin-like domain-containing protein [Myxococcota bacterium]